MEGQTYLSLLVKFGSHFLPARILTPDVQQTELYTLRRSYRETDSLTQGPFDSTKTVSILPSQRANGRLSKR